ncbi:MAG: YbhB/YbcL family Raf kinase inhibitor-like protein [Parachlamydia sp.]|nr:YbhB/YbcL family Raf kinase inhibitor-like protein [Parachlamydia sp.]
MKIFYTLICCLLCFELFATSEESMLKIESPAFKNKEKIPAKYTCEGKDRSPPLLFSCIPAKTKSLALIVDDPDAPMGTFDHWIAWNLPPTTTELAEGASVPSEGINGFGSSNYRGPCPPPGKPHHYFFKLYALDTTLDLEAGSTKAALENAMKGHILSEAELVGLYQR